MSDVQISVDIDLLKPGESLTEYVNRVRPAIAPEIPDTAPRLDNETGSLAWRVDGWRVSFEADETGGIAVHWHAPAGSEVVGFSLDMAGEKTAAAGGRRVAGWPVSGR